jgi:hypothetical protein
MATVYKWRIYCNTEDTWSIGYGETEPILCYNNNTHEINLNSVQKLNGYNPLNVVIEENTTFTQGRFRIEGFSFTAPPNEDYIYTVKWKIPVRVLAVYFSCKEDNIGDIINNIVSPGMTIGILTNNVNIGDTIIPIISQVFDKLEIGFEILINNDFIGEIIDIDQLNKTITIGEELQNNYIIGSLIKVQVRPIKNLTINSTNRYSIGLSKIGGALILENTLVNVVYSNKSLLNSKDFTFELEYLY